MTDLAPLKQFVSSSVCLQCEGCCRFQSALSLWRPKWDKRQFTDDNDYVSTIADCGRHLCRFLNKEDSTCRVYRERPFECELYPFILSRSDDGVKAYVHLACPYVQDHQGSELEDHVSYLRRFFSLPATVDFLKRNGRLISDYTPVEEELLYLFTIPELKS